MAEEDAIEQLSEQPARGDCHRTKKSRRPGRELLLLFVGQVFRRLYS